MKEMPNKEVGFVVGGIMDPPLLRLEPKHTVKKLAGRVAILSL